MNGSQHIEAPWGVSVFGAASEDVAPDLARLRVAIEQTEDTPAEAFAATHGGVNRIRQVLRGHGVPEAAVSTSRLNLTSKWSYGETRRFMGYECTASFVIELRDLDTLETVLIDLVDAGANQVSGVEFDVRRKKELRAQARTAAVAAAREKAALYAEAAGARLGPVVHIKDVDAEETQNYRSHRGHAVDGGEGDLTPGKVTVSAGIVLGFSLLGG
ncbi:SIMPL domain-containing protein [Streptomyces halstedii]|uniref:SIMPL domain-containing protein n=1 Tax=Streptomyces halstedii TaxID=1944 RepID=UPI00382DEB0A